MNIGVNMEDSRLRYGKHSQIQSSARVMIVMLTDELNELDRWGVPAGMPSRTAAVRFLLKEGLEAVRAKENQRVAG